MILDPKTIKFQNKAGLKFAFAATTIKASILQKSNSPSKSTGKRIKKVYTIKQNYIDPKSPSEGVLNDQVNTMPSQDGNHDAVNMFDQNSKSNDLTNPEDADMNKKPEEETKPKVNIDEPKEKARSYSGADLLSVPPKSMGFNLKR